MTNTQIGAVGGGQSLSLDPERGLMLLSGLVTADNGTTYTHTLISTPGNCSALTSNLRITTDANNVLSDHLLPATAARGPCDTSRMAPGPTFTTVGTFGDAQFFPMAHASELVGAKLYVSLSTSAHGYAIGVIDTQAQRETPGKDLLEKLIPMGGTSPAERTHYLWGMTWKADADVDADAGAGAAAGKLVGVAQNQYNGCVLGKI